MSKFKKIDKEFLLTDSTENCYGFRLLTSGYLMSEYRKNPIGYYMHGTGKDNSREQGVLVKWEDLRMDGDKVFGKPCINLSHNRGERTVDEIESGFLNAASCGHFVVLEISDKPEDYLPNQKGVSVSKWFNRECSLVDIPGNFNALTELFDKDDLPITLENLTDLKPQNLNMIQIILSASQLQLLNLKADSDAPAVDSALTDLIAKAAKVDAITAEKKTAEDALAEFKNKATEKEVKDLIAGGLTAKKYTKEVGEKLERQFAGKPVELKDLVDAMPAYIPITEKLTGDKGEDFKDKTWEELDKAGLLPDLKANNPEVFKEMYKKEFKKEYVEPK
jgi:hypothetical protein